MNLQSQTLQSEIRSAVRGFYDGVAAKQSCCSTSSSISLGCGDPVEFANIRSGEIVLDIGSGMGADMIAAGLRVGSEGIVVGIDLAPSMLARSAQVTGKQNSSLLIADAEYLPFRTSTFNVVISNCVINLCPSKDRAFREMHRVLKPNGRLGISDIVRVNGVKPIEPLNIPRWVACIGGAVDEKEYIEMIAQAGFIGISVVRRNVFKYSKADVIRIARYFGDDSEGLNRTLTLEGQLCSYSLNAFARLQEVTRFDPESNREVLS